MIQRIQSVYLFLVTVIMILPLCIPIARMIVPEAATYEFYSYGVVRLGEQPQVQAARLKLAHTVRLVLANGLGLLGVTAPEKM